MMTNPNPGSAEAIAQGCTCPVIDNNHGSGFVYDGAVMFWYSADCPVHCRPGTNAAGKYRTPVEEVKPAVGGKGRVGKLSDE